MYLRVDGVQSGPFDIDSIARDFAAGRLDRRVMSWSAGEECWTSLGRRWPSPSPRRAAPTGFGIGVALVAVASMLVACKTGLNMLPFALQTSSVLWLSIWVLVVTAILGLCWAWRAARRRDKRGLPVVLATVVVGCGCAWALAAAVIGGGLLQFRQHAGNATVTFDATQHALRVEGLLGPRLGDQLRAALQAHPDARILVLDSPGGLVEDALDAAQWVRVNGFSTRVDGRCASACVAIWAAGQTRQMTVTSRIGLHQLRSGADLPRAVTERVTIDLTRQYDAVLQRAGFSNAVIDEAKRTVPSSIYWLGPTDVSAAGVRNTIVDADGARVSTAMAQWLWLERKLGPQNYLGGLMLAARKHVPTLVDVHASGLYAALGPGRHGNVKAAWLNLYTDARFVALQRASDAALVAWARHKYATFGGATRSVAMCSLMNTDATPLTALKKGMVEVSMTKNLDELIEAIGPDDFVRDTQVPYSQAIGRAARPAWADVRKRGASSAIDTWSAADWCVYEQDYFGAALQLPQHDAAQAVRFLESRRSQIPRTEGQRAGDAP